MKRRSFLQLGLFFLAGCAVPPQPVSTPHPNQIAALPMIPLTQPVACQPRLVAAPTLPAANPSLDELDPNGLHVVNAKQVIELDPLKYRLIITGAVENPLQLSLDDLRCMPKVTATVNLTCKGNFEDVTTYSGVPLLVLLELARPRDAANSVYLTGADGYPGYVSKLDALEEDNFLAYEWKDEPLPIFHGFPVRAVMPTLSGYAWTKYLTEIRVE